jgi:hypothetical protein
MTPTKFVAILVLAASAMGVYAVQNKADDALPCFEGVEVPQIVVTAKRDAAE